MTRSLDDHMGPVWEEAFRDHLRSQAAAGELPGGDIVAIGRWWSTDGHNEIDAVALAGRARTPVLVGEAKWSRQVNGRSLARELAAEAEAGLRVSADGLAYALCARSKVSTPPHGTLTVTAEDIFP